MATAFTRDKLNPTRKKLVPKDKFVIYLLIFYEYRNTTILDVIGKVVYWFFDDLFSNQNTFSNLDKWLKNTIYEIFSGLGIPYILINIMWCHKIIICNLCLSVLHTQFGLGAWFCKIFNHDLKKWYILDIFEVIFVSVF